MLARARGIFVTDPLEAQDTFQDENSGILCEQEMDDGPLDRFWVAFNKFRHGTDQPSPA